MSLFSPFDLHLFHEGRHERLYEKLGARRHPQRASRGAWFGLWAPDAAAVSVTGSFNHWNRSAHPLERTADPGIWESFVPGVPEGALYKFYVERGGRGEEIPDPMALASEATPGSASLFTDPVHEWHDVVWQGHRRTANSLESAVAISAGPVHEAEEMGFTHVLLPPVRGFAPAGLPAEYMAAIDEVHNHQLGAAAVWEAAPGFDGREALSASRSAAVWWQERYHLDLLLGRDLALDTGWRERLQPDFDGKVVLPCLGPPVGGAQERLTLALLYAMPGKKLVRPPADDRSRLLAGQLNHLYKNHPALHQTDTWSDGFSWLETPESGVAAFLRTAHARGDTLLFAANLTTEVRSGCRFGVPSAGSWKEILNTEARDYGGTGAGNLGGVQAEASPLHSRPDSITVTLPPLSAVYFHPGR